MPRPDPIPPHSPRDHPVHGLFSQREFDAIMRYLGMLLGAGRAFGSGSSRSGKPGPNRRRRRRGNEPEREPVEPDNPRPLAGGAAAPLEYDD
ncbi:MAG TPA: hypothetical protein VGW40_03180 [Allosphingosinicella sp.]|nr:hypothetical protein [Allosphingosinicella sp.]